MFKKILVPTDGSTLAAQATTAAVQLAKRLNAQIVGVNVIDPFPYIGIGDASAIGLQAYLTEAKGAATQALDALRLACKADGDVVYEGIIETAEAEGCDLIVMGSHGHRGVKALILGSVAQKVLTHSKTPVLIVKG